MCFDEYTVNSVDQICQEVVGDHPMPGAGVDVKGKAERNADSIVQHENSDNARPKVEEVA